MKSKKDNGSKLAAFIILLIFFIASLVIGITGTVFRVKQFIEDRKPVEVIIHDFYEDGKLWFYVGGEEEPLGTYTCTGKGGYCGYAYESLDDSAYQLTYYNDSSIDSVTNIIGGKYIFIVDAENPAEQGDNYYRNEKIKLLEITTSKTVAEYLAVKNYSMMPDDNYIVKNLEGKWGVIQVTTEGIIEKVHFEYDYIGVYSLSPEIAPVEYSEYVALKDGKWYLVSLTGEELTAGIPEPIWGYEKNTIITTKDGIEFNVYNQKGKLLTPEYTFDRVIFTTTGYVALTADGFSCSAYDDEGNELASTRVSPDEYLTFVITGSKTQFITSNNHDLITVPSKRNFQEEQEEEEEEEEEEEQEEEEEE